MTTDFALPDLGEGLTESEIVSWHVAVGDAVTLNQIIAEVETAKAIVELPSPYEGRVAKLYVEPGVTINVGEPIVAFDVTAETSEDAPVTSSPDTTADVKQEPQNSPGSEEAAAAELVPAIPEAHLVGYGARPDSVRRRPRPGLERPAAAPATSRPTASGGATRADARAERPRSTPPVRKLATDLGIDLAGVHGTGEGGLITRADVETRATAIGGGERAAAGSEAATADTAAAARPFPAPAASGPLSQGVETRTAIHGLRRRTAEAVTLSAFTAPHVTLFLTVDVTESVAMIARLKADPAFADHGIGILAVTAKALCLAIKRSPSLNTRWDDDAGEIVTFHRVGLGIAAATERGLIVPNIPDAAGLDLAALADAIRELAATARAGRTPPERLTGGTISITNVGVFGIDAGTPILNPGEAAILALGAVRREPREHDGGIALREVLTLSLSVDHRLVDGAEGARFLGDIAAILRDPARAITMI